MVGILAGIEMLALLATPAFAQLDTPVPIGASRGQNVPAAPLVTEVQDEALSPAFPVLSIKTCGSVGRLSANDTDTQIAERQFALGMQELNANDPACAIPLFDAVLASFPFAARVLANHALANAQLGNWESAEAEADRAISIDGSTSVAFNVRGIAAARRGDHALAIAAFSRSIELFPNDRYARIQRMRSYYFAGQTGAALADADWLISVQPSPHSYEVASNLMADVGRGENALEKVNRAITAAKGGPRAELYRIKAHLLVRLDRRRDAVAALDQAITLMPTAANYLDRAEIQAPIDWSKAIEDVKAARRLEPQSNDVVRIQAWLMTEAGDARAAVTIIDEALARMPGDVALLGARSYAHEKLGQIDAMLDDLDSARRTHPNDMAVAEGACLAKAQVNRRLDSARTDCAAAVSANPYGVSVLKARGLLMLQTGQAANAAQDYALASRIDPTDAEAHFGIGLALIRLKQTAEGNAELATAQKRSAGVAEQFAKFGLKPTQ